MSVTLASAYPPEVNAARAAFSRPARVAAPRSDGRGSDGRESRLRSSGRRESGVRGVVVGSVSADIGRSGPPGPPVQVTRLRRWGSCIASAENPILKGAAPMTANDAVSPNSAVDPLPEPERHAPDRNLALELARVTEAASMAGARWVGRGDKNGADGAAVNAMRLLINSVSMQGGVVIGEGGDGAGPECDVAVDPIDGTRLCANGMPNAVSVLAVSARGSMFDPSAVFYMDKLATGPEAAGM